MSIFGSYLWRKVTCWQQRIDPETEVSLRRKKQRPVSIAGGEVEAVSLKAPGGGLKKVPSLGSLTQLDGVNMEANPAIHPVHTNNT